MDGRRKTTMNPIIDLTTEPATVRHPPVAELRRTAARKKRRPPEHSFYGRFILVRATVALLLLPPLLGMVLIDAAVNPLEVVLGATFVVTGAMCSVGACWMMLDRRRSRRAAQRHFLAVVEADVSGGRAASVRSEPVATGRTP
jgi:hypothetical protein